MCVDDKALCEKLTRKSHFQLYCTSSPPLLGSQLLHYSPFNRRQHRRFTGADVSTDKTLRVEAACLRNRKEKKDKERVRSNGMGAHNTGPITHKASLPSVSLSYRCHHQSVSTTRVHGHPDEKHGQNQNKMHVRRNHNKALAVLQHTTRDGSATDRCVSAALDPNHTNKPWPSFIFIICAGSI